MPQVEKTKAELWLEPDQASSRSEKVEVDEPSLTGAAARDFLARRGGSWAFDVDRRTGKAALIQGSGIPLLPGAGNRLGKEQLRGLGLEGVALTPQALEPVVRSFLVDQEPLLRPASGELVLDLERSLARDDGRLQSVYFRWVVGGVPVEGANVFVRLNSGNITQLGSALIGEIDLDTTPAIRAEEAWQRLLAYADDAEQARSVQEPELLIQPEDGSEDDVTYRLIWRALYRVPGAIETWEGRVDAHTGEVVGFRDINQYARAVGGIYPRTVGEQNETRLPLPLLNVNSGGPAVTTDTAGSFPYSGESFSSGLNGLYFDTSCQGCSAPAQPALQVNQGSGRLDFGLGGQDQVGNGLSTPADRNTFYHLNQVRRVALKWLPQLPWLATTNFTSNVNINLTCNATYSGSAVNFYRSGSGCNNTGEISDVIQHEWGHGIDAHTGGGDMGEGTADVTAMHVSHSPLVGPGFRTNGNPVRNLDAATVSFGSVTFGNYVSRCGSGVHCFGQIYGQTAWELAQALRLKYGHHTGWRTSERLFYASLSDAGGSHSSTAHPIYDAYLNADDDDGNLTNGTPNAQEIYAAFNAHEIAGAALPASTPCTRPTQPALTVTPSCDRLELAWPAVAGVDHYEVLRAELKEDTAYFPVAVLPSAQTSFTDFQVAPGLDYWYVVMAVNAADCESTVESPVLGRLTPQPVLSVTAAAADDIPRGNRSGFPDPAEEVDLVLTLSNFGEIATSGLSGTLVSSTPGVSILSGVSGWSEIPPGGSSANQATLRFQTGVPIACGDELAFQLVPSESTGCAVESSYFKIRVGASDGQGGYVCDSTPACYVEPDFNGLLAAASGSSCGEVDLSWQAAASNCTNATISYNVYRSTDPGFVPSSSNRIAGGLTSTAWTDTLLAPGQTYHYIARAFDPRAGEDANLQQGSVTAPTTPDIRPPVFSGIGNAASGTSCGESTLGWAQALESCNLPISYQVYRSANAAFTPGAENLVASVSSTSFVDAALTPGTALTYLVRARDAAGNESSNEARWTVAAGITDLTLHESRFEADGAGWQVVSPNNATAGNWERADPQSTDFQPDDDATPDGVNCWITGPLAGPSGGSYDVDNGTTTLLSAAYNLSSADAPVVRYSRWFTNDRGAGPGEDPFVIEVSNDDGASWSLLEQVGAGTPLAWVPVEIPLSLPLAPKMRFRFSAADLGAGSLVEAGIDDFSIAEPDQGCTVCPPDPATVGTIFVTRSGDDIVLDWTADPAQGARFAVYSMAGPAFDQALRVGTTAGRSFVHQGAALDAQSSYYKVTAVDSCGNESALD